MVKCINKVIDNNLCSACGICTVICPKKAVILRKDRAGFVVASINEKICIECGLCLTVCPSAGNNNTVRTYEDEKVKIRAAYIGYAVAPSIRKGAQSGGTITALNKYLLESGQIDAVATVGLYGDTMDSDIVFIDKSEQLMNHQGSYYVQTPMCKAVEDNRRLALTLLGCQSQAIASFEKKHKCNVEYKLGLICSGLYSSRQMEQIIHKSKVAHPIDVRYKDKRFGKWPGDIAVRSEDETKVLPSDFRIDGKEVYLNFRCYLCADKFNQSADVVCGDPWGMTGYHSSEGYNVIIARTEKGLELLKNAEKAQYIHLDSIETEDFLNAQDYSKYMKHIAMTHELSTQVGQLEPYPASAYISVGSVAQIKKNEKEKYTYLRSIIMNRDSFNSAILFALKWCRICMSNCIGKVRRKING